MASELPRLGGPYEDRETVKLCALGAARSLEAYWEYAQIDIHARVADSASKFCVKHVKRRPVTEAADAAAGLARPQEPRRKSRFMLSSYLL